MSNILIIHSGLQGITNACLELSNRLTRCGHKIYLSSLSGSNNASTNASIVIAPLSPIIFDYNKLKNLALKTQNKKERYQYLIDKLNFKHLDQLIEDKKIDLVLIDMELHEYILYLHSKRISFVLISQFYSIWKAAGNLPLSAKHLPTSKVQQEFIWLFDNIKKRAIEYSKLLIKKGPSRKYFLLELSRKLNINQNLLKSYRFPMPLSYDNFPVISMTHPELEFTAKTLPNLRYVYPMVNEKRADKISKKFQVDFEKIKNKIKNGDKKLIVVTTSTMSHKNKASIAAIISAIVQLGDCIGIFSLGNSFDQFIKFENQDNIYLYKSIPQLKAFEHANLSINHGGIHTVNECIHYKLPMLVLSGNKYDQNGSAMRVHNYGCGISNLKTNVSAAWLKENIRNILLDSKYKKKIEALNQSYETAKKRKIFNNYISEHLS